MTSTRPKRSTRQSAPPPIIVEDDATIVHQTLDRILYTVDVMARFEQTHEDIAAFHRGEIERPMSEVMAEGRWHELASKARKECPLGSTKKKRYMDEDEDEEEEEDDPNQPSTSKPKTPKQQQEKKTPQPSKAKLAAMKKKADAARRKAQREEAKRLAELEDQKDDVEDEEQDDSFIGMPVLEDATMVDQEPHTPESHVPSDVTLQEDTLENELDTSKEEPPEGEHPVLEPVQQLPEESDVLPIVVTRIEPPPVVEKVSPYVHAWENYEEMSLYPLDFVPVRQDVPGRVWCPPREVCQATNQQVVEIGPLTELETLDLTICFGSLDNLLPEKSNLIVTRMLELQIPMLKQKLLDPGIDGETRDNNFKQLEIYESQLEDCRNKGLMLRLKIVNLPDDSPVTVPSGLECIEKYTTFDENWYCSSRKWFDGSSRRRVTQQDFVDQFEETDDPVVLQFQQDMLAKARELEEQDRQERIDNFDLPLCHDLTDHPHLMQERMFAFRNKLAHTFQYEAFEENFMTDPACREIFKKLQPLPYNCDGAFEEAEAELIALISAYKTQFSRENPVLPMPKSDDVEGSTARCLADVIDTIVLRELIDVPNYPHRIPIYVPPSPEPPTEIHNWEEERTSPEKEASDPPTGTNGFHYD